VSARQTLFIRPAARTVEGLFQSLTTLMDTLDRLRSAEQAEDEVDLTALNAAIAEAQAEIAVLTAALEAIELSGALTAQQAFELALVTQVDTLLGSVSQLVTDSIRRSEEAADAVIRSLVEGRKNAIAIRVEQTARLTDREAFVSQLSTFDAQLGISQGLITEEIQARADGDTANALLIQNVSTALNGNVAQVQILTESIDGISARWGVAINQNGQVTGLVQLDGDATGSTFTVVASNFRIAQPNTTGGDPIPVYSLQTVDGETKLALRGDMYADGAIVARAIAAGSVTAVKIAAGAITAVKIAANAVTADKIAANAVTANKIAANTITANEIAINGLTGSVAKVNVFDSEISITTTTLTAMSGMSLTVTVGSNEKLLVTFTASATRQTRPAVFRLYMNGTRVTDAPQVSYPFAYIGSDFLPMVAPSASFSVILSPPAGTHTLQIRWANAIGGTVPPVYNHFRYFAAMRFLK
jgi:hypothetical protein